MGRAPSKSDAAPASSKLTKISAERQLVQRLQYVLAEVDRLPLPVGELGCQFLDCLELCEAIRSKVRDRAKQLLLKSPGIIPCWHVCETAQRRLSPADTARVFDALSREDDRLSPEQFLEACTTNLSSLRKLLAERNPDWSPDELEYALNHALMDLIHFETVTRLSRSKGRQIELSL